jgi:hypothetical protein
LWCGYGSSEPVFTPEALECAYQPLTILQKLPAFEIRDRAAGLTEPRISEEQYLFMIVHTRVSFPRLKLQPLPRPGSR